MVQEKDEKARRLGRGIAAALVLAALALGGAVLWWLEAAPRTDDAYVYADTIGVAPDVGGRIIALPVRDNQPVRKGELLFRLDPRPYRAALDKAQAALVELDREIALTQRTVRSQALGAAAAAADVGRAQAAARQADDTLGRIAPLRGTGYASDEQIDQARTAAHSARAQLETARLEAQRAAAGVSGTDALEAKRAVLRAEIALARLNLDYTTVRAPFDGIVVNLKTAVGQYAQAGQSVFTLVNRDRWYVVANFRETDLAGVRPGRTASVYVLSDPGRTFAGTVESIGYGVFPDDGGNAVAGLPQVPRSINWVRVAQRFPVRIRIARPDPAIFRIGASAVAILGRARPAQGR